MRSAETMQRARFSVPVTPHHRQGGGRGPRPGVAVRSSVQVCRRRGGKGDAQTCLFDVN